MLSLQVSGLTMDQGHPAGRAITNGPIYGHDMRLVSMNLCDSRSNVVIG